jgi:hypothetical protein
MALKRFFCLTEDEAALAFELSAETPPHLGLTTESRNVLSYLVKPLTDSVSRTFRE